MRARFLSLALATLPLAATGSTSIPVSIRIVSQDWLAKHDAHLLATPRVAEAISKGIIQEKGKSYLLVDLKGNPFKFEVPEGTEAPEGQVRVRYVPLSDQGHQRLVALSVNDMDLHQVP